MKSQPPLNLEEEDIPRIITIDEQVNNDKNNRRLSGGYIRPKKAKDESAKYIEFFKETLNEFKKEKESEITAELFVSYEELMIAIEVGNITYGTRFESTKRKE